MNTETSKSCSQVDGYGEDPFALTENCDYPPPSTVSSLFSSYVVGTKLRYRAPRQTRRPDLVAAVAQTSQPRFLLGRVIPSQ